MTNIPLQILTTLNSHNTLAIEYLDADANLILDTIVDLLTPTEVTENSITPRYSHVSIYNYSHPLKFRVFRDDNWRKSDIFQQPPMGMEAGLYYLREFLNYPSDGIFVFQDIHKEFINEASKTFHPIIPAYLREIATQENSNKKLIFLGEKINFPPELLRLIPTISIPLPSQINRENAIVEFLEDKKITSTTNLNLNDIAQSAAGLSLNELKTQIDYHYNFCVNTNLEFNSQGVQNHVTQYKTNLLKKLKIEVVNPKPETDFGGHEILKQWLEEARILMQPEIAQYGLPKYKGCLLGGVSGCGKTLVAETLANQWNLPLIKLSIPALKGGLVGQSEGNLKKALKLIENIQGVVLLDEVEKAISGRGTDSSGVSDGMLSILLDWMNEQNSQFVVATANDVTAIPSELLRSGRLNERWFVGLPGSISRLDILEIHLFSNPKRINPNYIGQVQSFLPDLNDKIEGFSGAEIAELVQRGLGKAILNDRPTKPQLQDFLADMPVPLAKSHQEQHREIMAWSKNAKMTSTDVVSW